MNYTARGFRTLEDWLADIERRQLELETALGNFLKMHRNAAHMTTSYLDRELGYQSHEQQRQARRKRGE